VIESIIAEIDVEICRLQPLGRSWPMKGQSAAARGETTARKVGTPSSPKKRFVSPEARERMRQGQLKRWAAAKKSAKPKTSAK
jgi:hypothetical protein